MRMLDLFSGLRGWTEPYEDAGHDVYTIDFDHQFEADAYIDIGDVDAVLASLPWEPDVVLASPPCTSFSMMSVGTHWTHDGQPKTETAVQGRRLVLATLRIIATLSPRYWVIENPRARLRTLGLLDGIPRHTVTYCQYGESRMKPTDLWGRFPETWTPLACGPRRPCHVAAPRGSRTGTQGSMSGIVSAKIPYKLSQSLMLAIDNG